MNAPATPPPSRAAPAAPAGAAGPLPAATPAATPVATQAADKAGNKATERRAKPDDKSPEKGGHKAGEDSGGDGLLGSPRFNFYGSTFKDTAFGAGQAERRISWAETLRRVDHTDCAGFGDAADALFDEACLIWQSHQIIVLRHQQGGLERAEVLLKRVAFWAGTHEPALKLMGVPNDRALPLGDLSTDDAWPVDSHGALVMLERRQEPMTTRFLSTTNQVAIKALHDRLRDRRSRLLISIAAEWDAGEGRLEPFHKLVKTLEIGPGARPAEPVPTRADESAFDAIPRIVAGLFEGLGVDEFKELVDALAADLAPPVTAAPPPMEAAAKGPPPPPPAPPPKTRHQRWLEGDVDRVLADLGVRYVASAAEPGATPGRTRSVGYGLADAYSPYAEPGWVIAHHPSLLASRAGALLDRYLGHSEASQRFRDAFLGTLARLDSAGVRALTVGWLMEAWRRTVLAPTDLDVASNRLRALVEYLDFGGHQSGASLPQPLIETLGKEIVEHEIELQATTGSRHCARRCKPAPATPSLSRMRCGRCWTAPRCRGGRWRRSGRCCCCRAAGRPRWPMR